MRPPLEQRRTAAPSPPVPRRPRPRSRDPAGDDRPVVRQQHGTVRRRELSDHARRAGVAGPAVGHERDAPDPHDHVRRQRRHGVVGWQIAAARQRGRIGRVQVHDRVIVRPRGIHREVQPGLFRRRRAGDMTAIRVEPAERIGRQPAERDVRRRHQEARHPAAARSGCRTCRSCIRAERGSGRARRAPLAPAVRSSCALQGLDEEVSDCRSYRT